MARLEDVQDDYMAMSPEERRALVDAIRKDAMIRKTKDGQTHRQQIAKKKAEEEFEKMSLDELSQVGAILENETNG